MSSFKNDELLTLAPSEITVEKGFNPRSAIEKFALAELTASVKSDGILQPVLVTTDDSGKYVLVAGHRRHAAALAAKLDTMPALLRASINGDAKALAVVENIQRVDLNPIDEAIGFRDAMAALNCNQSALAKRLGKSQAHVTERLRLLKLPEPVQNWIASGELPPVVGKVLMKIAVVSETFAVYLAYAVMISEDLEPSHLASQLDSAMHEAFEVAADPPTDLPALGAVLSMNESVYASDFTWSDENIELRDRLVAIDAAHGRVRWTEDDVDAARAYGCLLELAVKQPWGGERIIRYVFDAEFLLTRLPARIEAAEQSIRDRAKASVAGSTPGVALSPEDAKAARKLQRDAELAARHDAHARNKDVGALLRKKFARPKLTQARLEALLIAFVEGNDDLAGAGLALCDDTLIEEERIKRKSGRVDTRVTVLDRFEAHSRLIERIRAAKTNEEKFGVVWQAMLAAEVADQSSRPQSDRRSWNKPGSYSSPWRSNITAALATDAQSVLPQGEREAAAKAPAKRK